MKLLPLFLIASLGLATACQIRSAPISSTVELSRQSVSREFQTIPEILQSGVEDIRKARFADFDKNNDGRLVVGEVKDVDLRLPGLTTGFKSYDTDQDGEIVLSEFLRADVIGFFVQFYDSIVEDNFFLSDLNRDKVLTDAERNEINQKLRAWPELNGGDADGDNMLDYREYLKAYLISEQRR